MKKRGETLGELFDERIPLYERYADIVIDCDGLGLDDTVAAIISDVKNKR